MQKKGADMEANTTQTLTLSREEAVEAEQLVRTLADVPVHELQITVRDQDGHRVVIPPRMAGFLHAALRAAAAGRPVAVGAVPEELTSVEAAKMIGVSRPTLIKMARTGEIPSRMVGTHTRFLTEDVRAFLRRRGDRSIEDFNTFRDAEAELLGE